MTDLAAPNVGNYTFGANKLLVGGVDLGNIVSAACTVSPQVISHFSALHGEDVPDDRAFKAIDFVIEATLDEPNKTNMFRHFLADSSGKVGMGAIAAVAVSFEGIAIAGNSYTWAISKAVVRPSGQFGFTDEDWVKFGLIIKLLPDFNTPLNPWGVITHNGVP